MCEIRCKLSKLKDLLFFVFSITAVISIIATQNAQAHVKKIATPNLKEISLLEQPYAQSKSIQTIAKSEILTVISADEVEGYYYVSFGNEKGYVKASEAKIIAIMETYDTPKRAKTRVDDVNLRAKPNIEAPIVCTLKKNSPIDILERVNSWYKVYDGRQTGYIDIEYADFLSSEEVGTVYSTLKMGMTGKEVTRIQQRLSDLGYFKGVVDGTFGAQTREAVEKYQAAQGLLPDGNADEDTLKKLFA